MIMNRQGIFLLVLSFVLVISCVATANGELEYIVKYKSYTTESIKINLVNQINSMSSMNQTQGGATQTLINVEPTVYSSNLHTVRVNNDAETNVVINTYQASAYVEYIEPNYPLEIPNGSWKGESSQLEYYQQANTLSSSSLQGGLNTYADSSIDPRTGDDPVTADELIVAVLDSGVDYQHPELCINLLPGYNFVDNNPDTMDRLGHGTAVAGLVASKDQRVKILPVKVIGDDGSGKYSTLIEGIYYAVQQGAKIINLSLGCQFESKALLEAVEYAVSQDVLLIAAAGNYGNDFPIYPAAFEAVLSIGALDEMGNKAFSSNYGETVDLFALGENVSTTFLNQSYTTGSGTSVAAAIVSNAAAQLAMDHADRSMLWVGQTLKSSARDLGAVGWDRDTGYGALDLANTFFYTGSSDLGICGMSMSIEKPQPGQETKISYYIRNAGIYETSKKIVYFRVNGTTVNSGGIPALKPGAQTCITFRWCPALEGSYQVTADFSNLDSNPRNNKWSFTGEVTSVPSKKVEIQNLFACYVDDNLNIKITFNVVNNSNVALTVPLDLRFRNKVICTNEVITLQPGEVQTEEYIYPLDPLSPLGVPDTSSIIVVLNVEGQIISSKCEFGLSGFMKPLLGYGVHEKIIDLLIEKWAQADQTNKSSSIYLNKEKIKRTSTFEDFTGFYMHGWDPDKGAYVGWMPLMGSAYRQGVNYYDQFTSLLKNGEKDKAVATIGGVLHLLTDMATPAHAHADMHIFHDFYEEWANKELNNKTELLVYLNNVDVPRGRVYYQLPVDTFDNYKNTLMYKMAEIADNFDSDDADGETLEGDLCYVTTEKKVLFWIFKWPVYYWAKTREWKEGAGEIIANGTLPTLAAYIYDTLYWYKEMLE